MDDFDALIKVADQLIGPNGCPWDQKQTFLSLQPYVLEEAHEVVEAVDSNKDPEIIEELGDLLYTIIFYGKLAEKEKRFTTKDIINAVREKLIRRHPHVFGETKVEGVDDVVSNWEKIKKEEKKDKKPSAPPPTLSLLMRGQKIAKKMKKSGSPFYEQNKEGGLSEEKVGEALLAILCKADASDIDAEGALRRALKLHEEQLQEVEKEN